MNDPLLQKLTELTRANGVAQRQPGEPRYAQIRARLRTVVAGAAAGLRLPTIREMAAIFHVTGPVVRRAVVELAAEGVLHIRPRSGVFVDGSRNQDILATTDGMALDTSQVRTLTWFSECELPHQRLALEKAIQEYEAQFPRISVAIHYANNGSDRVREADILDASPLSHFRSWRNVSSLNISALIGAEQTMLPYAPGAPRSRCMVPVGVSIPCVIFNEKALATHAVAPPRSECFADQLTFFARVRDAWEGQAEPPIPIVTHVAPHVWMGSWSERLLRIIQAKGAPQTQLRALRQPLARLAELAPLIYPKQPRLDNALTAFQQGRVACFVGWNYHVEALQMHPPDFPWSWRPAVSLDDRIPAFPRILAIRAETAYPIECARLIEKVRERLLSMPLGGGSEEKSAGLRVSHLLGGAPTKRYWVLPYLSEDDIYLYFHVISDEFMKLVDDPAIGDAADAVVKLGRAYLAARVPLA
ncbi:MAG: GntR family transcriptional regulator [Verrucomicrobia bacterium]|nr:GntR family transcriptional regulator [Verrucomicrobiota bacterium]